MPGRGYRGGSGRGESSRGSSPGIASRGAGRGRGGRGRGDGGGRGRGRGSLLQDMSAMALDYDAAMAARVSHSHPQSETFKAAQQASKQFQQAPPSQYPASTASPAGSRPRTPFGRPLQAGAQNGTATAGPGPSTSFNRAGRGGLGSGFAGRRNETYKADPNLSKPISFVKAVNGGLDATITEASKAKQKLQEQAISIEPSPIALEQRAPAPKAMHTDNYSRRQSLTQEDRENIALADEVAFLHIAQTKLFRDDSPDETPASASSPQEDEVLFLVDTEGDRSSQQVEERPSIKLAEREVRLPPSRPAASGKENVNPPTGRHYAQRAPAGASSGSEESETEEMYPRKVQKPATDPATSLAFAPTPVVVSAIPYARTIDDSIDTSFLARTFQPFAQQRPIAQTSVSSKHAKAAETEKPAFRSRQDKKKAKREKKERKAERKKGKKGGMLYTQFRKEKEEKIPREGDSDVEWGDDGPPKIRGNGKRGATDDYDDIFDDDESSDSDEDESAVLAGGMSFASSTRSASGKVRAITTSGKKQRSRRDQELEALAADYASNLLRQSKDDSDDSETEEIDADALKSFLSGMSGGEHLTMDDLADLAAIRAEDRHDEEMLDDERRLIAEYETASSASSSSSDDEETDGKGASDYPVYVPEHGGRVGREWDTDPESEDAKALEKLLDSDASDKEAETDAHPGLGSKKDIFAAKEDSDSVSGSDSDEDDGTDEIVEQSAEVVIVMSDQEGSDEDEDDDSSDEDDDEEGDDVEDFLDDMIKASLPARRNKVPPTFDSDAFDEHLQEQWRKDREKKAIKRQERALARLEGKASKANKKKAKRAGAKVRGFRSDKEHSARGDFSLFGEDMDEDMLLLTGGKQKRLPEFHKINEDLKAFIDDSGFMEFVLPPMDKKFRYAIHMLADAYNMKSKSRGAGHKRHNVLYRTQRTTVKLADQRKVNKYLSVTATWSRSGESSYSYSYDKASSKANLPGKGARSGNTVSRNYDGAVVGEGADKISAQNRGYGMLAKMGWTEGMQIGKEGGLSEPIRAIVKTSKTGLGAGWVRYSRGEAASPVPTASWTPVA